MEYVGGEKMVVVVVNVVDDGPTALCNNGLYYVLSTNWFQVELVSRPDVHKEGTEHMDKLMHKIGNMLLEVTWFSFACTQCDSLKWPCVCAWCFTQP